MVQRVPELPARSGESFPSLSDPRKTKEAEERSVGGVTFGVPAPSWTSAAVAAAGLAQSRAGHCQSFGGFLISFFFWPLSPVCFKGIIGCLQLRPGLAEPALCLPDVS